MSLPNRYFLATAVGLWLIHPTVGQEPSRLDIAETADRAVSSNQRLADTVAEHLRQSGRLKNYRIDVAVADGTVELNGHVSGQTQKDEAVRLAQGIPGVDRVISRLALAGDPAILPVQAGTGAPPIPPPTKITPPTDPAPIFQAPTPSPYDLNPPKMPPYAWPTYAPYNNYSRVAYPSVYPYEAFPNIGPVYPYPKVPLGWRKVKLEFEDGHWWFGNCASQHDFWRLRYW